MNSLDSSISDMHLEMPLAMLLQSTVLVIGEIRSDIEGLDNIIKTSVGHNPGILLQIQSIRSRLDAVDKRVDEYHTQVTVNMQAIQNCVNVDTCTASNKEVNTRLGRLERLAWIATGGVAIITFFATTGDFIARMLSGLLAG